MAATAVEQCRPFQTQFAPENGEEYESDRENLPHEANMSQPGNVNFDTALTLTDTLQHGMSELSDEQFYEKLMQLKNEHKKTLEACERLYNDKLEAQRRCENEIWSSAAGGRRSYTQSYSPNMSAGRPSSSTAAGRVLAEKQQSRSRHSSGGFSDHEDTSKRHSPVRHTVAVDSIRDMGKPPPGKIRSSSQRATSVGSPLRNSWVSKHSRVRHDLEEDYWKPPSECSSDAEVDINSSDATMHRDADKLQYASMPNAVAQIGSMWDNFAINDYMPARSVRQRRNSISGGTTEREKEKQKQKEKVHNSIDTSNWKHRVTIPKPFKMTTREEVKEKKKTRAMLELEQDRKMREEQALLECQKKFKAKPVPAHVYMPLYDEITEQQESRRRKNLKEREEQLRHSQSPFKFTVRTKESPVKQQSDCLLDENSTVGKKVFTANPFPSHIFDPTIDDKVKEEEEYRKIRMQMRSEELLRSARAPTSMETKRSYSKHDSTGESKYSGSSTESSFRPRINHNIPNFDELHRNFQKEMSSKLNQNVGTVCKPFNLLTKKIPEKRHKIYDDIESDTHRMQSKKWQFQGSKPQRPMTREFLCILYVYKYCTVSLL